MSTTYYSMLNQTGLMEYIRAEEFTALESVEKKFPFYANEYYLSLMNLDDPKDPIRKIVIPDPKELVSEGTLDPSGEQSYTVLPGLQHKYPHTAMLLVNNKCGGICRFCFRKRFFTGDNPPGTCDLSKAADYLQNKPDVTDVLLSGGDPLLLPPSELDRILSKIREISHIPIIRIGTKLPAYDPYQIIENPDLTEVLAKHTHQDRKIYVINHFNHSNEITDVARSAIGRIKETGTELINQTPLIAGVNDDPGTLATLFKHLSFMGVSPYYVFQCRPTLGNHHLSVPIERGMQVVHEAQARCSGLAKRARYIMSHKSGKIEMVGRTQKHIFMRYHQVASPEDTNKMLVYRPNPHARWLEDYKYHLSDMVPKMTWLF
ncbi:MAG: KamA family radical SAM protein [Methanobacteriota archaeon]